MTSRNPGDTQHSGVTRRTVLGTGAGVAAATILPLQPDAQAQQLPAPIETGTTIRVSMSVNGQAVSLDIDSRASLLDLLRERLGFTGTKKGCDHGQCGACTIHLDGRPVVSCLTLAAKASGREVTTIEGLASGETLHPMQTAFIDHDALQCGYCTPGQIMSAVACVHQGQATNRDSIREFMSGNICRCGAYAGIVAAIEDVAANSREG
ncbi:xanthine dehydrogenase YagT iron-sulfur-binding subunit [Rhizobium petrolearium]|uniref:(2Fe-2S)-binding protein n=1 Tax=Neorhizobium petrolearium TaxID=515361 RepID=UPI001AE83049|nr:(2Fe-2S)-binding protein [Neorhizobium petrolearium]MBP1846446.1 xanthine dehydrogenase YagT iron-sulfur-binding subunit [Neorhizobium petrolearium]